jgi:hypothetical protein
MEDARLSWMMVPYSTGKPGRCWQEYFYEVGGACGGVVVNDVVVIRLRDEAVVTCAQKGV